MNNEIIESEKSGLHEKLQSGQLIIGLSSTIPGFIRKDPAHKAISFAPFYLRDSWIDLPITVVQELAPAPDTLPKEHLPFSFTLKPGGKKEKVLIELIDALSHTAPIMARGNGKTKSSSDISKENSSEIGICCRCTMGDEFCVDCYLGL